MNVLRKLFFILSIFIIFTPTTMNKMWDKGDRMRTITQQIEAERRETYIQSIIEEVEWHAEVVIPDYLDVDLLIYMYETAVHFNLPIRTAFRLIRQESRFKEDALSPVGAYGFTQLMPDTYDQYHRKLFGDEFIDDHNPYKNIYIGLYYLRELYDYWDNFAMNEDYIWALSLASYNAGKGRVIQYKGIPPFRETRHYVSYIMREHSQIALFAQN
jgi:hypothetical protein